MTLPPAIALSAAPADLPATTASDAVDETSADPTATADADFDPRTHPDIKDSLVRRAWALDARAHRWYGTDKRLCGTTTALLTWARALRSDDRASAADLRNLHLSIELLPQALRDGRAPINPHARMLGAFARAGQAVRGIHRDLRLLTSSSKAGATRHNAKPPTEEDLQQRLIEVDQELFRLETKTSTLASKLDSEGREADRNLAVALRYGELRHLRATYNAATDCGSDASGRWNADALLHQVEAQMTKMWPKLDALSPTRGPTRD